MWPYILAFFMLCLVLYLAYISTKWLGKQMQFKASSKYMQVIDKLYIDRDKLVLIVKFQDSYRVVAMSSNAITDLGELSDLDESAEFSEEPKTSFSDLLVKYREIQKLRKKKQDGSDSNEFE